jgi:hypothetical protein
MGIVEHGEYWSFMRGKNFQRGMGGKNKFFGPIYKYPEKYLDGLDLLSQLQTHRLAWLHVEVNGVLLRLLTPPTLRGQHSLAAEGGVVGLAESRCGGGGRTVSWTNNNGAVGRLVVKIGRGEVGSAAGALPPHVAAGGAAQRGRVHA